MSQLYLYIFKSLFGLLQKDSGNLFSDGIGIQLRPILCSVDGLLQQQHEKNDLVAIARVCSSHYVHFLSQTASNTKDADVWSSVL